MSFRRLCALATSIFTISCVVGWGEALELTLVDQNTVSARLRAGVVQAGDRQSVIERLFRQAGCRPSLQPIDKRSSNVICTLPGETSATIVVGAHFDFADVGEGVVDDWSGASLLSSLYQTIQEKPRKHTYQFVAFAAEERGLVGSSHYVKRLTTDERTNIKAFINLECLGLTTPKVWVHRSSPMLVSRLSEIASAAKIPLQEVDVEKIGDDDTHPFLSTKIPVISIHSVTQETWRILHRNREDLAAINCDEHYDAYRLVAFYLAYLDVKLPAQTI